MLFSGANDLLTVANHPTLNVTDGLTLEAWVKLATGSSGVATILGKERTNGWVYCISARTSAGPASGSVMVRGMMRPVTATGSLPVNQWRHVAFTYTGYIERLYIDGEEAASRFIFGSITTSTGALRIGGQSIAGERFKGTMDEVRVYNRALSAAEIRTDMNAPISPAASGSGGAALRSIGPSGGGPNSVPDWQYYD